GEQLVVARGELLPALDEARELPQLREPERALDVAEPVVEAELDLLVEPGAALGALAMVARDAVVAERPQAPRQLGGVRRDGAALAGRDVLDGVEAERGEVGERAD